MSRYATECLAAWNTTERLGLEASPLRLVIVGAVAPVVRSVVVPESSDLQQLVEQIAGRIGRALERRDLIARDIENAWLATAAQSGWTSSASPRRCDRVRCRPPLPRP
jgi:hypothetical protein